MGVVQRHQGCQGDLALPVDLRLMPADARVVTEQDAAALAHGQHATADIEQGVDLYPVGAQWLVGLHGLGSRKEGKDDGQADEQADQITDHGAHQARS
ncbi:hypothetical protein D3C71_2039430 [compost metagenome]